METTQKLTRAEIKILAITLFIAVCGGFGIDIHLASMPSIMADFNTNKEHMQQSVSLFLFGMGASMLFYGPLSDKYGRRPIIIFGLSLGVLASAAAIFAPSIEFFLTARLIQGVGIGACVGLSRTIFADTLTGMRFILIGSYLSIITSLSPLVAPALGGYIQQWFGWHANFAVLSLMLLLALMLYSFLCPETNQYKNPKAFTVAGLYDNYKTLILHPIFVGSTLLCGIAMAATMTYATTSAFIFQGQFHLSPVIYGWITTGVGVGNLMGKLFNTVSIRRLGSNRTILIGLILLLAAGLWLLSFLSFNAVTVTIIVIAVFATLFCQAFIMISATSFALMPFYDKRGAASALFGSFQMLTAFLASAIAGAIAFNGVVILAMAYCLLGILGIAVYFLMLRQTN